MNIIRRILSLVSAGSGRRGGAPAGGRRGRGPRGAQPKATGLAALRGLLRR